MALVFAAIVPHGDLVLGERPAAPATRVAFEEVSRRFAVAEPEVAVIVTPHNVHVEGHFAVVTAARVGEAATDVAMATSILRGLQAAVPAVGVSYGGNDPSAAAMPIDWGTEIPLAFLPAPAIVVVSPARDRPFEEHIVAGRAIAEATAGRRVAMIASADHGHAHDAEGPYGLDPAAVEYDRRIDELVRQSRLDALPGLGELVGPAKADSLWQLLMLHGALGDGWEADLLSYEVPTYYGMLCATFTKG